MLFPYLNAMDQNPDVIMYPDDPPKSKLVWQGVDIQDLCLYNDKGFPTYYTSFDIIIQIMNNLGYEAINLHFQYFSEREKLNRFPLLFRNEQNSSFFLVFFQDNFEGLTSCLDSYACKIHSSVLLKDKWSYPRKASYWNGKYEILNEMSLRYVDCFVHCLPNFSHKNEFMQEKLWEKSLYKKIRECGLNKAIDRIGVM